VDNQLAECTYEELMAELTRRHKKIVETELKELDPTKKNMSADMWRLMMCSIALRETAKSQDPYMMAVVSLGGTALAMGRPATACVINTDDEGKWRIDPGEARADSEALRDSVSNWFALKRATFDQCRYLDQCCDEIVETLSQHDINVADLLDRETTPTPKVPSNIEMAVNKIKQVLRTHDANAVVSVSDSEVTAGFCLMGASCVDPDHADNKTPEGLRRSMVEAFRLHNSATQVETQIRGMLDQLCDRAVAQDLDPRELLGDQIAQVSGIDDEHEREVLKAALEQVAAEGHADVQLPPDAEVNVIATVATEIQRVLRRYDVGAIIALAGSRFARTFDALPRVLRGEVQNPSHCGFAEGASKQEIRDGIFTATLLTRMSVQAAERAHGMLDFLIEKAKQQGVDVDIDGETCPVCEAEANSIPDDKTLN